MILIDSSIWIDHLRRPDPTLMRLIADDRVLQHRLITAELAMGSLANREPFLARLDNLQQVEPLPHDVLIGYIKDRSLFGTGLGVIDAHLLLSAQHMAAKVWTRDRRLDEQAGRLGLAYQP